MEAKEKSKENESPIKETALLNILEDLENEKKKLKESQVLLQRIINLMPIRIFWKDKNSVYLGCNTLFAKDAGKKKPEDLIGKDDFQMGWKEQANLYRADDKKTMTTRKSKLNYEEPQTTPKGDKIWLKTSKIPLTDLNGNLIGVLGTYEDITEHKKIEEALSASEARYRSYIDATGQIAWVTNTKGEIEEDVPLLRKFSGQTYEEAKGFGWAKTLHPDDVKHTLQVWHKAVTTKTPYEVEYRMRRHDGVYRNLLARGFPVFRKDGSILEWVGTCIDITERKKTEEKLKENEALKNIATGRESIVGRREETAKGRENIVGRREETAKGREKIVGRREKIKIGIGREGIIKGRESVVSKREETAKGREQMAGRREKTAKEREKIVGRRERESTPQKTNKEKINVKKS